MIYETKETVRREIELKSCPFCGSEPKFYFTSGCYGYTPNVGTLMCPCGIKLQVANDDCSEYQMLLSLAFRWNRRV